MSAKLHQNLEIERKYLIRMPDVAALEAMPGCEIWDLVQTYLRDGANGETRRVRSVETKGEIHYIHTEKRPISALSHDEWEAEVSAEEYHALLQDANPDLRPIEKRRYRIPYAGQLLEIDLYSFWNDRATLEIEMRSEEEQMKLPEWLSIIRELTGERAYKNRFLAEAVPMEELP